MHKMKMQESFGDLLSTISLSGSGQDISFSEYQEENSKQNDRENSKDKLLIF